MIFASTTFFEPDWPRRVLPRVADRAVRSAPVDAPGAAHRHPRRVAVIAGLAWIAIQVAIPLRHHVIPGDYRWTNEGYRLAWTVLVTEKGGDVSFRVSEPDTGRRWRETARNLLTTSQWRVMTTEPELIRQAAHMIADEHARRGREVEVRADAFVSLNGRRAARLIDSRVDLAAEPWRLHQQWITNPEA
jgi:hypothetical protein